jgi:hypothetical protein
MEEDRDIHKGMVSNIWHKVHELRKITIILRCTNNRLLIEATRFSMKR